MKRGIMRQRVWIHLLYRTKKRISTSFRTMHSARPMLRFFKFLISDLPYFVHDCRQITCACTVKKAEGSVMVFRVNLCLCIVNRGSWLSIPVNIKEANKQAKMEVGRSTTEHIFYFSLIHSICMNYVIAMFLLLSCMNTRYLLLYFARFSARSIPKTASKNLQQRTLLGFITISLY